MWASLPRPVTGALELLNTYCGKYKYMKVPEFKIRTPQVTRGFSLYVHPSTHRLIAYLPRWLLILSSDNATFREVLLPFLGLRRAFSPLRLL